MKPFIDVALGSGQAWVRCEDCDEPFDLGRDFTGSLRVGVQVPGQLLEVGADVVHFIQGSRQFTTLAVNLTSLPAGRRLLLGAGFGFAGYRDKVELVDPIGNQPTITRVVTFWGFGLTLHGGVLWPVSRDISLVPRVTFTTQLGHPVESSAAVPGGIVTFRSNVYVLAALVGVHWRER